MNGRVLGIEMRRGPFWGFLATILLIAALMMPLAAVVGLEEPGPRWWTGMARGVLTSAPTIASFVLAVAAWQGGRERRRRTEDLLSSTSRPPLHRALAAWLPTLGWPLLAYAVGVLGVGTLVGLTMGRTPSIALAALFAVVGVELAAAAAFGFMVGWYVPGRFVAPFAGVAALAGLTVLLDREPYTGLVVLAPFQLEPWDYPVWWFPLAAAVWFGGLAAAFLGWTATKHRRWFALVPLAAALIAAAPIARLPEWRIDTDNLVQACGPETARRIEALPVEEPISWRITDDCNRDAAGDR